MWADLKKIADVWKSQPSLNDFDAGALRAGGNFWLSPVTGLPAQICWPRPELRDRLRFPAVSSISILQASAWAGIVRRVCIPMQTLRSILGGPASKCSSAPGRLFSLRGDWWCRAHSKLLRFGGPAATWDFQQPKFQNRMADRDGSDALISGRLLHVYE